MLIMNFLGRKLVLVALFATVSSLAGAAEEPKAVKRVTVRGSAPWAAFDDLRHAGLRVLILGSRHDPLMGFPMQIPVALGGKTYDRPFDLGRLRTHELVVPCELRFRETEARSFVEQVAQYNNLKTYWTPDGTFAILQPGASDASVSGILEGLKSPDPIVRTDAARRARWAEDVRVMAPLTEACRDSDPEVSRQALRSLCRLGWAPAMALSPEPAMKLAAKLLNSQFDSNSGAILLAIGEAGGEPGFRFLASFDVKSHQRHSIRDAVVLALGFSGGDRALEVMTNRPEGLRADPGITALGAALSGGSKAPAIVEAALFPAKGDVPEAPVAAGLLGREEGTALLIRALDGKEDMPRARAAISLGWARSAGKAGDAADKILTNKVTANGVDCWAMRSLGSLRGAEAIPRLEKQLGDRRMQPFAAWALGDIGGNSAAGIVEAAFGKQLLPSNGPSYISSDVGAFSAMRRMGLGRSGDDRAMAFFGRIKQLAYGQDLNELRRLGPGRASQDQILTLAEKTVAGREGNALGEVLVEWLGDIDSDRSRNTLLAALGNQNWGIATGAAYALGAMHGDQAIPIFERALNGPERLARGHAARGLGHLGGAKSVALLEKQAESADALVRGCVVEALKIMGGPDARRILLAMAKRETDRTSLQYISDALGQL